MRNEVFLDDTLVSVKELSLAIACEQINGVQLESGGLCLRVWANDDTGTL